MQKLKVTIAFSVKADADDHEAIKEEVYSYLQELMEDDDLDFEVESPEDEDGEDEEYED